MIHNLTYFLNLPCNLPLLTVVYLTFYITIQFPCRLRESNYFAIWTCIPFPLPLYQIVMQSFFQSACTLLSSIKSFTIVTSSFETSLTSSIHIYPSSTFLSASKSSLSFIIRWLPLSYLSFQIFFGVSTPFPLLPRIKVPRISPPLVRNFS